jgi:SPP1 gp7 family putative phage head morphogenesis protein
MEVEHVIRAAVTSSYIVGLNYVGSTKKRLHHMFLTVLDIEKIKTLTAEFNHIFWRRVAAVLHQKDTVQNILKSARFSPRSSLTLNSLVTSLAVKIVTKSIALATVAKVNALRSLPESKIKSAQVIETLVWITQRDERVCSLCQGLDGFRWNSDDPNILIPPDDAHDNCRCRLDIAQASDIEATLSPLDQLEEAG